MNIEQIRENLARLENDETLQNYIVQANARYILLSTREGSENFPRYTITDERLELLAFYYLELGCALAENHDFSDALEPLGRGAAILEFVHAAQIGLRPKSNFYTLISSLSFYVGFHYSKAFVLIQRVETSSIIGRLIKLFLQRDFLALTIEINELLSDDAYSDESIAELPLEEGHRIIAEFTIATALDLFTKYFYSGDEPYLTTAREQLTALKEICELSSEPEMWWVARLLILIQDGFASASVWMVLRGYFPTDELGGVEQYIRSLIYNQPRGIFEFFLTQRRSFEYVLTSENKGCIVSIPTSSGKTRIAEVAILQCLLQHPTSKVLYIAPFRSLAFEVENSLEKILEGSGIPVSHLYGGTLYSTLDKLSIEESRVIISTPEKAKAILRSDAEFISQIALIILDEGHLLGSDDRLIMNEVFYEELRFFTEKNDGKFLLLSAVLPNPEDLALWLAGSTDRVYKDTWRPSDERFGILEWTGTTVNLKWESKDAERSSFNPNFIIRRELPRRPRQQKTRYFPNDCTGAVVSTAYKLKTFGPVLIFVGLKASVLKIAKAYASQLDSPHQFVWDYPDDWNAYELACVEAYGHYAEELILARLGILCHHADFQPDVKLPLERLMRRNKPLVIVATSTLGQGVNLGVSSVIFATIWQGNSALSYRDFWNIAGRAGRAYVDSEGKILVVLDASNKENNVFAKRKRNNDIEYKRGLIKNYFRRDKINHAESGILELVKVLRLIAERSGVSYELLLELIADNKLSTHSDDTKDFDTILDTVDDGLLMLHIHHEKGIDVEWVEHFFSKSLAYIQAVKKDAQTGEDVIAFVKARLKGIFQRVGTNNEQWHSIVQSSLPLSTSLMLDNVLESISGAVQNYLASERKIEDKLSLLVQIEREIADLPVMAKAPGLLDCTSIDVIRFAWLSGIASYQVLLFDKGKEVLSKLYAYLLPWVLNGIAQKFRFRELIEEADAIAELALCVETGLPTTLAIKVYQAGIRSRVAALELSSLFMDDMPLLEIKRQLIEQSDYFKSQVSDTTQEWLDLLTKSSKSSKFLVTRLSPFILKNIDTDKPLTAHTIGDKQYLLSSDRSIKIDVTKSEINFTEACDKPGIFFRFSLSKSHWQMVNENPYFKMAE